MAHAKVLAGSASTFDEPDTRPDVSNTADNLTEDPAASGKARRLPLLLPLPE
jgi:hypothetical protein